MTCRPLTGTFDRSGTAKGPNDRGCGHQVRAAARRRRQGYQVTYDKQIVVYGLGASPTPARLSPDRGLHLRASIGQTYSCGGTKGGGPIRFVIAAG
jgi:hypothetical protein